MSGSHRGFRRTALPKSNLSKKQKDALKNLRTDKSLHILKAYKGNATVILDRDDCENKIRALLETPTYKELKQDTTNIERKVCSNLSYLRKAGIFYSVSKILWFA